MEFWSCVYKYNVLFRIQQPQNREGVLKCLSEAEKTQFLTKKRPFLAAFFMKNGKFWCIRILEVEFA